MASRATGLGEQKTMNKHLVFDGKTAPESWPSVSLCMIVKNEAETLTDCLQSVGDFATEIIIVDTGSTDCTVEIARQFGARVEHFAWIDDFAAARNESFKYAASDWIFWMDADDRLSPDNLIRLKQALVSGQADVYACPIDSNTAQHLQARATAYHFRLFRNHVSLRFQYPLHEDMDFAAAPRPITVAYTNAVITHVGYGLGDDIFKAKTRRNLEIVKSALARHPDNIRWHYYQGVSLSILNDYNGAIKVFENILTRPRSELVALNDINLYYGHLALVYAYHRSKQPAQAEKALQKTFNRYPQRHHLAVTAAMFFLDRDDPQTALVWLEKAAALPPEAVTEPGQRWLPGTQPEYAGLTHLLLGDLASAQPAYLAMKQMTGPVVATTQQINRAKKLFKTGQYRQVIDQLLPVAAGQPEVLRIVAQAEYRQQLWHEAAIHLAQAIGLSRARPGELVTLAAAWILKTGGTTSAKNLCRLALSQNQQDAAARDFLEIIEHSSENPWLLLGNIVTSLLNGQQTAAAQAQLKRLSTLFNLPPGELLRQHGMRHIHQKEHGRAMETFALLIDMHPADAAAYKSLAVALNGLGKQAEAMAAWQAARQLE